MYLEYCEMKRRREIIFGRSSFVMENGDEEDTDLLSESRVATDKESHSSNRMEIQLEPLS